MENLSPFGRRLRHWRKIRGFSQLRLATEARVSPRHVSFVETGRSRPGEGFVLKLADVLDVPLRDRNDLLRAAGLAPAFPERDLSGEALAPLRHVVDTMLARHEPFPAYAIDRAWFIVAANGPAQMMAPGADFGAEPVDAIELFFGPGPWRALIDNFAEVANAAAARIRREALHDDALVPRVALLERHLADVPEVSPPPAGDAPVIPTRLRLGDRRIDMVTVMARFGTAQDVTLDELRVELVFPANPEAERVFLEVMGPVLAAT